MFACLQCCKFDTFPANPCRFALAIPASAKPAAKAGGPFTKANQGTNKVRLYTAKVKRIFNNTSIFHNFLRKILKNICSKLVYIVNCCKSMFYISFSITILQKIFSTYSKSIIYKLVLYIYIKYYIYYLSIKLFLYVVFDTIQHYTSTTLYNTIQNKKYNTHKHKYNTILDNTILYFTRLTQTK